MSHKVRVGTSYIFYANLLDYEHRDLNGRVGTVVNLHGAPPANTMGHCYFQVEGERFRLVSTNSLYKMSEKQLVIDAIREKIADEQALTDARRADELDEARDVQAEQREEDERQHDFDPESQEERYGQ